MRRSRLVTSEGCCSLAGDGLSGLVEEVACSGKVRIMSKAMDG